MIYNDLTTGFFSKMILITLEQMQIVKRNEAIGFEFTTKKWIRATRLWYKVGTFFLSECGMQFYITN